MIAKGQQIRRKIGVPENGFLLISVGELNHNKNHETVIRALAELNDRRIHYGIVGIGELKRFLADLADEQGVGAQVHLFGFRDDVPELYKASDICVFPSIREGQGLAAIEGMAAGLPLIVSENRGLRDIVVQTENAYICQYNDSHAFAGAILSLLADSKLCSKMGYNNLRRSKEFDCSNINMLMKKIYLEIEEY